MESGSNLGADVASRATDEHVRSQARVGLLRAYPPNGTGRPDKSRRILMLGAMLLLSHLLVAANRAAVPSANCAGVTVVVWCCSGVGYTPSYRCMDMTAWIQFKRRCPWPAGQPACQPRYGFAEIACVGCGSSYGWVLPVNAGAWDDDSLTDCTYSCDSLPWTTCVGKCLFSSCGAFQSIPCGDWMPTGQE